MCINIKERFDDVAKEYIQKTLGNIVVNYDLDEMHIIYINRWLSEESPVKCYTLLSKTNAFKSFALLRKCDFDPIGNYTDPWVLEFIFTAKYCRRERNAYLLLKYIIKKHQITAFYNCGESYNLFKAAGFKQINWNEYKTMRYP